jgi:hypothetical protein
MKFRGPSYVVRMEGCKQNIQNFGVGTPCKMIFKGPSILEYRLKLNIYETACVDEGRDWLRSSPMVKCGISNIRETNKETVSQSYVSLCVKYAERCHG